MTQDKNPSKEFIGKKKEIEIVFSSHKEEIVSRLNGIFFSYVLQNVHTLSPRKLSEYALEEYEHFVSYLSDQGSVRPYDIGAKRAHDGLFFQSVQEMTSFFHQFCLKNFDWQDNRLMQELEDTISKYDEMYVEGFVAARRERAIHQQEEMRQAIASARRSEIPDKPSPSEE